MPVNAGRMEGCMEKEFIGTGRTVEEAIDSACEQLGIERELAEWEILDLPKRSLLGFRSNPARVKVTYKLTKVKFAQDFLVSVLDQMGLAQTNITVEETPDNAIITLEGEGLGVIIGRRGETLDALQYLTGLVANKVGGDYFRITLDSGHYRYKREKTLEELALRLANTAVKTGRSSTLEPMNPYERRVIHASVQTIEGATSASIGEEPNRRVVISSKNPIKTFPPRSGTTRPYNSNTSAPARPYGDKKPYSGERKPYNAASKPYNGDRKPYNNDRKPYTPAAPAPSQQPKSAPTKEAADKPLYSKIDLD